MSNAVWQTVAHASKATGATLTINKPSGTVDGDLLLAIAAVPSPQTITAPAGWTKHANSVSDTFPMWWKVASSEPASYDFTVNSSLVSSIGVISRWNTQAASSAVEDVQGVSGTGTSYVIPAVTSGGANRALAQMVVKLNTGISFTGPGSQTERWDAAAASGSRVTAGGDEIVGSGSTGTRTWTASGGASAGVAYSVLVKPIPANTGSFADGAYDFTGSDFTGEAGPGHGTFSGDYDFTGSTFPGEAGPGQGQFTGLYDFTGGPFVGEAPGVSSGQFVGVYDFTGSGFTGERTGEGSFTGVYDFTGSGFVGSAPSPTGLADIYPGGRERFTARRTPKNRRRSR